MTNKIIFHFLDVGDGDCTLIEFPSGRVGLVDINTDPEKNSNWDNVVPYIVKVLNGRNIFRFILTHPHQDHLHGLKSLIDAGVKIDCFWHTDHKYEPDKESDSWETYKEHWRKYSDWEKKLEFSKENHFYDFLVQDNIEVLSPSIELCKQANELGEDEDGVHRNNYVLKITNGNFTTLLCGDADSPALNHLMDNESDKIRNCTLMKAPHHGTETHWNEGFVKLCNSKIIILHQGENLKEYSHEKEYDKKCDVLGITREHGVIVIEGFSDGSHNIINGNYNDILKKLELE